MKTLLIVPAVVALLGLSVCSLLAADTAPATQPHHSRFVRHAEKIGLNLTNDQITKIDAIAKTSRGEAKAVLTAEQVKILQDAKGKGKDAKIAAWKQVKASLTADQKAKLKEIRTSHVQAVKAVLTPEQIAKLKEYHKEHHRTTQPAPAPSK